MVYIILKFDVVETRKIQLSRDFTNLSAFNERLLFIAEKHFSIKRQCEFLYQSLCMMPLKLIECVLPWLIGSLTKDLKNISSNRICCSHTTFVVGLARLITMFNEEAHSPYNKK
ncbi:hypothetical protein Ahy_A06g029416 isoform B [Arachis hypogaea]|uniref:Uncharacterized protein n=1 Tax=Arachis hypogaea TaxID=3818 RepID=A0A445CTE8_ARAHY|nr:hypothetical protein Ahy_A06g029416 isoform B [Arachis hypogaea]